MNDLPTAIVTGGSRGIGRAICLELAELGYAVTINYASNADAANEVVNMITEKGGRALAVQADIGNTENRKNLLRATVTEFGHLDLLVNNAGISSPGRKDLLEATEESWDKVLNTNLKGPFFMSQIAANEMIANRDPQRKVSPKIINVSSISAFAASSNRGDYCISKAATQMMTALYAARLAEHGIGVFEICPGVITSDMTASVKDKYDKMVADGVWPIQRWGQPEDVAKAVRAIASDCFPFSTGQQFMVDGGFHIRRL